MLAGDSRLCRALELFFAVPDSGVREGLKVWSVPRLTTILFAIVIAVHGQ